MAKARPQTVPARRPPTPDPRDIVCPHQHFKYDIIDRDILSRKQHQNLLCTPKGYRWVMMKGDAPDDMKDNDLSYLPCKIVKKKPGKTYVHNILAELWSLLTPEMVTRLKEMLIIEFGLTEEAAVDFICHTRYDTLQTAQQMKRKKKEVDNEFEDEDDRPPGDLTLPRLIVEPPLCDKSQFAVGIDPCHIKEFSRIVSTKFSEYVAAMMCARRNNRHRRMAEVVLNGLCNLTGEKTTLDNPKNRLQKILTLTSDRIALWLAENMDNDDSKRDRMRRKEDEALKKKKIEKKKEQERRKKEKDRMNKEIERNKKRKAQEEAELDKQKQEEQERKKTEKEKKRREMEKFREEDQKKKEEEQRKAKEEEEKKKEEKRDKQEKSKQRATGTKSASAKPAKKDETGTGKQSATTGRNQKPASAGKPTGTTNRKSTGNDHDQTKPKPQQARDEQEQERRVTKEPKTKESDTFEPNSEGEQPSSHERGSTPPGEELSSQGGRADTETTATGAGGVSDGQTRSNDAIESPRPGAPGPATAEATPEDVAATQAASPPESAVGGASDDQTQSKPMAAAQEPAEIQKTVNEEPGTPPPDEPSRDETGVQSVTSQQGAQPETAQPGAQTVSTLPSNESVTSKPIQQPGESAAASDDRAPTLADGQPSTQTVGQGAESERKIQESIIAVTTSQIGVTEPVATPRQETLQDILSKELEKRIEPKDRETSEIIREVASKTATWIDQNVKDAEIEYGSRDQQTRLSPVSQKAKGPLFVLKKIDPMGQTYDVRLATHTEAGEKIRAARKKGSGRNVPSSAPSDPSDPKMWAKWAVNASQMADDWGHWIDKTIQDAEDKAVQYQTKVKEGTTDPQDEEDWKRFVASTTEDALSWRRKKKSLDEVAKKWKVTTR